MNSKEYIRVSNIIKESLVNGEGIRTVIFLSGCELNCKGCHNKDLQNPMAGKDVLIDGLIDSVRENYDMIDGVTLSGGDPFFQYEKTLILCKELKSNFPEKSIWVYTGKLLPEIIDKYNEILKYVDVIVDGPYIEELNTGNTLYRGSSNQKIIEINNN